MSIRFLITAAILSIFTFFSCHSSEQDMQSEAGNNSNIQLPPPMPLSVAEKARIADACENWYNKNLGNAFNGGMIVAKNGNIVFEKYHGTAHLPGTDTVNQNTPMHIASVSKTFTAMAVLKLWQDGKLNIDDPVSKYLPQFNNYPGVTIRTLLNHRSGLPNYLYFMDYAGWDKTKYVTNADILNYLVNKKAQLKDISAPNTHFQYCNTNYALLALVIEKVTGKTLPEYLKDIFFGPLQMKNTFVYTDRDSAKTTPSYNWRNQMFPFAYLDKVYGDKNVFTTPRDLLIWDRALCSGKIFTQKVLDEAYKPYSKERPGVKNYGLGWHLNLSLNGKKVIYHNGYWHGNNAVFTRLLKDSATIIVLGNKFNRNIYHAKELLDVFGSYGDNDEEDEMETPSGSANNTTPANPASTSYRDSLLNEIQKD